MKASLTLHCPGMRFLRRVSGELWRTGARGTAEVVGRGGVEPPTFRFSGGRSYQLSYLPRTGMVLRPGDPDGTRTRDLRRDRAAR